jgi:aldehyde:ferredoxin oxidoreductase
MHQGEAMPHGYNGKILKVNLSSGKIIIEEPGDNFYRKYLGGEGFVGYYLLKEMPAGAEPLGPDNRLIFAAGPLTGVPVGGCGRHSVGGKSPLTGGFGESESGGFWGAELKMAGFDAVVIEGRAEKPVYLFIKDGEAQIRDASHLWGLKTLECQDAIREELGDSLIKVAQIGPAGEKLVRFACVVNDLDAFAGRTGMGAVMGSKNLKALACRGHQHVSLAVPDAVSEIGRWVKENAPIGCKSLHDFGTAAVLLPINKKGGLPTFNFRDGVFDKADNIGGQALSDAIFVRRRGCFACPVQCKREVKVDGRYAVDSRYGGPHYETIAALGSNCGIGDIKAVAKASELTAAYGVDSISCGSAIAFAMECFEAGLLKKEDTGGLELRFGNAEAMLQMVERISLRQGLGDMLAEGVARAAQKIGPGAAEFAVHVRGQEVPMHEPRWKHGLGIGYLLSPTGADHCHNMQDSNYFKEGPVLEELKALGVLEPLPVDDLSPAKIRMLIYCTLWQHFLNSAVCCYFVVSYGSISFEKMAKLVSSVTGWNTTVFELIKAGERAFAMAQAFNIREGIRSQDVVLPERLFKPFATGPLQGVALDRSAVQKARETYCQMMGWPGGSPSEAKLGELGIDWVAPMISQG